MAEIKLFDTWTFQEEMPEPFSRFLQKEGLRKTTTMVECLSQYNQGRQATLHPPTLRAMLNIAGIYLKGSCGDERWKISGPVSVRCAESRTGSSCLEEKEKYGKRISNSDKKYTG